jgi:hypothetical protein
MIVRKHKSNEAKEALGHKIWKDRLTLVLYSSVAKHTGKKVIYVRFGTMSVSCTHWGY